MFSHFNGTQKGRPNLCIYMCVCRLAMFHDANPSPVLEGLRSQILLCGGCEGAQTEKPGDESMDWV